MTQGEAGESLDWQLVSRTGPSLLTNLSLPSRESPLCQLDWELHITEEGIVEDVPGLLEKVFRYRHQFRGIGAAKFLIDNMMLL
jgi:hypothetical protein